MLQCKNMMRSLVCAICCSVLVTHLLDNIREFILIVYPSPHPDRLVIATALARQCFDRVPILITVADLILTSTTHDKRAPKSTLAEQRIYYVPPVF